MNTNCYIAGPMRTHYRFNFPAFFAMADHLRAQGFTPINPAQLDIDDGYDPASTPEDHDWNEYPPGFSAKDVVDRDLKAIQTCEYFIMLPGWEKSVGANAERGVLLWRGAKELRLAGESFALLKNTEYDLLPDNTLLENGDEYEGTDGWRPCVHTVGSRSSGACRRPKRLTFPIVAANVLTVGTNPKDRIGSAKPNIALVPPALMIWVAKAMENGARKYGPANWRDEDKKVRKTVYIAAAMRHLLSLLDGEDLAEDSGLPHEAHAAACCGILLDAAACGTLIDDRSKAGPASKLITQLTEKK